MKSEDGNDEHQSPPTKGKDFTYLLKNKYKKNKDKKKKAKR